MAFAEYEGFVRPEWIDSNDHMNLAYYTVLFDQATDVIYDAFGMDQAYKTRTGCGTFAVESHNLYVQELLVHERVRVRTHVLAVDAKRLHLAHEMLRLPDGKPAAMQELMYLHIDLGARRVKPWPADVLARITALRDAHAGEARPDWVGRKVAMPGV